MLVTSTSHSSVLQTLLRQDDTNGGVSEAFAVEVRYMQSEDSTAEADSHSAWCKCDDIAPFVSRIRVHAPITLPSCTLRLL